MRKLLIPILTALVGSTLSSQAVISVEAYYRLGEAGVGSDGLPVDSSGNARDFVGGDVNYGGYFKSSTSPAPGSTQYYYLSGSSTGFSDVGWDPPESNIGVEAWVRSGDLSFDTSTTVGSVVFGTGDNTHGIGILYDNFGAGFVGVIGNVDYVGTPYQPKTTNEWVHVAVVRDNGVTTFYLNGTASSPVRTGTPVDSTTVYLGYGGALGNFNGSIDEARIFTFNPGEFYPKDLLFFQSTNTVPYITAFIGGIQGFTIKVADKTTTLDSSKVSVSLAGNAVTPTITKSGLVTTIAYTSTAFLTPGSTQAVTFIFADSAGVYQTNQLSYIVGSYSALSTNTWVPPASLDTSKPGFLVHPYQTDGSVSTGLQPNTLAWTEDQVIGLHGDNIADLSGADANGFYAETGIINYSVEAGSGTDFGDFPSDAPFPGIPGTLGTTGDATEEIVTFLNFPAAGSYTLGVNSDDGFKVSTGKNPRDRFSQVLGFYDGGRGASDTLFTVVVPVAGAYPFRVLWENGNGEVSDGNAANLEFFSVLTDGTKVLINDTASPIKAYRTGAVFPPYISRITPADSQRGVNLLADIEVDVTDQDTTLKAGSIQFSINGASFAAPTSVSKSGSVTTAKYVPSTPFTVGATYTVAVTYSDSASYSVTNTWSFSVLSATLPIGLRSAVGTGIASKPGFTAHIYQVDYAIQNELPIADQLIHGVAYSNNVADLSLSVNGDFYIDGVINWNKDAGSSDIGLFQSPDYPDAEFPGLPGSASATYENFAVEALTFLEFPAAGIYTLGVCSDDGFRVTAANTTGPDFGGLTIVSPTNLAAVYPTWPTYAANGGTFGGPLMRPGVQAKLVKAYDGTTDQDIYTTNSGDASASYTFMRAAVANAADLKGNIAVVRRGGGIAFATKAKYCQDAGAIAVIVVNRPDLAGSLPIGMGGSDPSVTIPVAMVDWGEYSNFWASVTTNKDTTITVRFGEDNSPVLGQFDTGRGATDTPTTFDFYVPQAGLYPFRLLYFQGNGGASCEFFSVNSAGDKILVNDSTVSGSIKAYRARTVTAGKLNKPVVSGNNVTLSWTPTGELQEADSITGPWQKASDQSNPQTRSGAASTKFFRLLVY